MKTFIANTLSLLLIIQSHTVVVAPLFAAGSSSQEPVLDQLIQFTRQSMQSLDARQYDLEALLEDLNYEAEDIIAFVQEQIGFEQYPGVMRGALGTLMTRSGNALDQAILMATLLKDAGYDAQILRGQISPEQAQQLLAQMKTGKQSWDSPYPEDKNLFAEYMQILAGDDEPEIPSLESLNRQQAESIATLNQQIEAVARQLSGQLKSIPQAQSGGEQMRSLLEEARDYFWLRYRLGPSDPWQSVHPAHKQASAWTVSHAELFKESLPEDIQQRFSIQLLMERETSSGKLEVIPLMEQWQRPVANLAGRTLSVGVVPDQLSDVSKVFDQESLLTRSNLFIPVLLDSAAPGHQIFNLNGEILPPEALGASGAVFATLSETSGKAAGLLDGLGGETQTGSAKKAYTLKRIWWQVEVTGPSMKPQSVQRHLYRKTADNRHWVGGLEVEDDQYESALRAFLTQRWEFLVSPGRIAPAYMAYLSAQQSLNSLLGLQGLNKEHTSDDAAVSEAFTWLNESGVNPRGLRLLGLAQLFDEIPDSLSKDEVISYRPQPLVLAYQQAVQMKQDLAHYYGQTDILLNERRSFSSTGEHIQPLKEETLKRGVWETALERMLPLVTQSRETRFNAFEQLASSRNGRVLNKSLTAGPDQPLARLEMANDIQQGYAVVAAIEEKPQAWWRINPETGSVIGMGISEAGLGGIDLTEETTLEIEIAGMLLDGFL